MVSCRCCGRGERAADVRFCTQYGTPLAGHSPAAGPSSPGAAQEPEPEPAWTQSAPPAYKLLDDPPPICISSMTATLAEEHQHPSRRRSPPAAPPAARKKTNRYSLFESDGSTTARFTELMFSIYIKIDREVAPQRTERWETSKMRAFQEACGLGVPDDFERVVSTRYRMLGCFTEKHRKRGTLLPAGGFAVFLEFKIKFDPTQAFEQLTRVIEKYHITLERHPLRREDLPEQPDPEYQVRGKEIVLAIKNERAVRAVDGPAVRSAGKLHID